MGKWVSLEEALPPDNKEVIVSMMDDHFSTVDVHVSYVFNQHVEEAVNAKRKISWKFWMPIQQPGEVL